MARSARIDQVDGVAVVIETATGVDAGTLRAEAARLAGAAHPGVVRIVASAGDDDAWELRTLHAGRPLDVVGRLDPVALGAIAVGVATTLADLHELGVVHGRLRAAHILIGAGGRPVLCGFGTGEPPEGGTPAELADDVAALGAIIVDHLGRDSEQEPIPERRLVGRRPWTGWARASLLTIADQACAEPASRRPSARRLAAAISEAVGLDAPDRHGDAAHRAEPLVEPRTRRIAGLAGAGLATVLVAAAVIAGPGAGSGAPPSVDPSAVSSAQDTHPTSQPTPQPEASGPARSAPGEPPRCPGRGCDDAGIVVDGNLVATPEGRYEVGRPGDHVAVGDWDCDGRPTPAVLRPATGEVFVFAAWASTGELAVRPVRVIPGATDLVVDELDGGCPTLQVSRSDGERVAITRAMPR